MTKDNIHANDWVEHLPTGRIGLVVGRGWRKCHVQFGASGPYESVWLSAIIQATPEQIAEKTGSRNG